MSGGVDSSASALLLREQGHEVIGLFMRSGSEETVCRTDQGLLPVISAKPHHQGCCTASDAADARRVADRLDIPFHALNFREDFGRIKDYFADEYLSGRTPNPCVMCNIWLKFGKLWEFAEQVDADFIATGHYARIASTTSIGLEPGKLGLFRGRDPGKDQSYVLFGIRAAMLDRIRFPVGDHSKPEIRELARQAGIQTADKPDSQEICFIPDNDYSGFLTRFRGPQTTAGEIVDTAGRVLGRHEGYERFTIGQRRGLGIAFGEPRFVVRIEPETRRVVIGTRQELGRTALLADRLNWLIDTPTSPLRCTAQIRYQHTPAACTARVIDEDLLSIEFDDPQFGVAPGQAVVLYDGDRVLGGGWIHRNHRLAEPSNCAPLSDPTIGDAAGV
jgi:tRNA-specific 2-thiouridylase